MKDEDDFDKLERILKSNGYSPLLIERKIKIVKNKTQEIFVIKVKKEE